MGVDNLVLIGFMGTGKSTVGRLCAERLGFTFQDTDALVAGRAGRTISEIFASEGEEAFRSREREVIGEVARGSRQVIATGGGAILDPGNARLLQSTSIVACLRARPDTILQRVGDTLSRPLLGSAPDPAAKIASLLEERERVYSACADRQFETDSSPADAVALEVTAWFQAEQSAPSRINVELGDRSYPIHIGEGSITAGHGAQRIVDALAPERICIVTHPALRDRYATPIADGLRSHGVEVSTALAPPGERYKTLAAVARLYDAFIDARLDRKGVVLAIGGGVLGDTAGFAAASFLRGIRLVQAPTTLLAQVDSSVGGKTGVNLPAGKNLAGAFHQPSLVLIDPSTLSTLPARELRSGLAEVIKYGIIHDARFFAQLSDRMPGLLKGDPVLLRVAIARSCQIKAEVVGQDETEQGLRAVLNYGHTVGHALEALTRYRRYKHGEAISIGMVTAALIGECLGLASPALTSGVARILADAKLPTAFPQDIEATDVLAAAQKDKKTDGGRLRFVLAREIGDVFVHPDVPPAAIIQAIERQRRGDF